MDIDLTTSLEIVTSKLEGWLTTFVENLPNLLIALVVLLASYFVSRLVYRVTLKLIYNKIQQTSVTLLIARFASVVVVLAGLFLALGAMNLGKTLTGVLSAAGITGLVIGLALQGTLSNMISGIILSFRKNIQMGNWIETNAFSGEVVDINLNYFVLKEADNNAVVIPNKTILENPFKNYSLTNDMRISLECGVSYDSDLERVQEIVKETIQNYFDQKRFEKEVEFYYTDYGASSINFLCRFWIHGKNGLDRLRAKSKAIKIIKQAFDRENITIPYPIRTLDINAKELVNTVETSEMFMAN